MAVEPVTGNLRAMTGIDKKADVILSNARVLTFSSDAQDRPQGRQSLPGTVPGIKDVESRGSWYVAVKGDKIIGVGDASEAPGFKGPGTREIDCQGMTLGPGFNDAHCHLMALASSLSGVDCSPDVARSIDQILEAIRRRAEFTPASPDVEVRSTGMGRTFRGTPCGQDGTGWIRAFGYDEFYLSDQRHPSRWDLDRAAPFHPVRLDHRTGHASVLNSRALDLLQISRDTPDPPNGIIERDAASGEPTGLLYEMGDYIKKGTGTTRDAAALLERIGRANALLLSKGITSIHDASPGNDLQRWQAFHRLKEGGHLTTRVTMMAGASHLQPLLDLGLTPGVGDEHLKVGAVKLMISLITGSLRPSREELEETVLRTHRRGFQLSFHAVEEEAVLAAAESLIEAEAALPGAELRHRIEHCSEATPHVLTKLKRSRAVVVTQPSFIYHNGEKYLSLVEERLLPHLYPLASLLEAGIPVAAGSDAPVTSPDPILSIYSAVTRKTKAASALSPRQAIPVGQAIKMHSIGGAYASFEEKRKGSITVGKLADLVLLDRDPTATEPEGIKEIKVMMTMVGGEVAWQR